ncbi:MAG: hypothetical protein AB3N28_08000, partial [Kordiimonas sp.]
MGTLKQQVIAYRAAIFAAISLLLIGQYNLAGHHDDTDLLDIDCGYCVAQVHADGTDITPRIDVGEEHFQEGHQVTFLLDLNAV